MTLFFASTYTAISVSVDPIPQARAVRVVDGAGAGDDLTAAKRRGADSIAQREAGGNAHRRALAQPTFADQLSDIGASEGA